jgi:hypothetical protein
MKLPRRQFLHLVAGAAALPTISRVAWAQAYPARPVRVVVPFAPGGVNDITARLIGQWLSERLGQQFIIENRPGAATNIATEAVARAAADGYTARRLRLSTAWHASTTRCRLSRHVGIHLLILGPVEDGTMPKPVRIRGMAIWDRHDLDEAFERLKPNSADALRLCCSHLSASLRRWKVSELGVRGHICERVRVPFRELFGVATIIIRIVRLQLLVRKQNDAVPFILSGAHTR